MPRRTAHEAHYRPPGRGLRAERATRGYNTVVNDETSPDRRRQLVRVAALFVAAAGLAAVAFWLPTSSDADEGPPLYPDDPLRQWETASPVRKRDVAEQLVERMHDEDNLGPRTLAKYEDPQRREQMIDALVTALDGTMNKSSANYASPGLSISFVATRATTHMGWRE